MGTTTSGIVLRDGLDNPFSVSAEINAAGTKTPHTVLEIGGLPVGATNPMIVGGTVNYLQTTPAVSAAAYAAGNIIGGLITLTAPAVTGILQTLSASFTSGVQPSLDVILFRGKPAETMTDNTALALTAADLALVTNIVHVTDFTLLGASVPSFGQALNLAMPFHLLATSLYVAVVTRTAITLTSTSDMTFTVGLDSA